VNSNEFNALRQNFLKAFEGNEAFFPTHLKEKHPRVISNIVMLWGSQEMDGFLNELLLKPRSGRSALSEKDIAEIVSLQNFHSRLFPKEGTSLGGGSVSSPDTDQVDQRQPLSPPVLEAKVATEPVSMPASVPEQVTEPVVATEIVSEPRLESKPAPKPEPTAQMIAVPDVAPAATMVSVPAAEAAPMPAPKPVQAPEPTPKIAPEPAPAAAAEVVAAQKKTSGAEPLAEPKPTPKPESKLTSSSALESKPASESRGVPESVQKSMPVSAPAAIKPATTDAVAIATPQSDLAPKAELAPAPKSVSLPAPLPASKSPQKSVSASKVEQKTPPVPTPTASATPASITASEPVLAPKKVAVAAPETVQKSALPPPPVSEPKPSPHPVSRPAPASTVAPKTAQKSAAAPASGQKSASLLKSAPETATESPRASTSALTPSVTPAPKPVLELESIPKNGITDRVNHAVATLPQVEPPKETVPQVELQLEAVTAGQGKCNSAIPGKIPGKHEKTAGKINSGQAAMPLDSDALEKKFLKAFEGNEGALPRKLKQKYPRIYRKIVVLWGAHEIDDYLDDLLIDTRGDRQGFPEDVMTELFELQTFHSRLLPPPPTKKKPDTAGITTVEQLQEALDRESTPQFELKLGEALVHDGIITRKQLKIALADQVKHKTGHLGKSLAKLGYASEEEIERIAAKRLGFVFVNLAYFHVEMEAMKLVPREAAIEHKAIPLCIFGGRLVVAVENPMAFQGRDFLSFTTGKSIVLVGATLKNINAQLQIYGEDKTAEEKFQDMQSFIDSAAEDYVALSVVNVEDELQLDDDETDVSDNSLVKLVNKMIVDAYDQGASDIHLESKLESKTLQIRFRRDGQLYTYYTLPSAYRNSVVSRLKIMSHLNIAERRRPQDGKIVFSHPRKGKLELRVATLPTAGGMEDMVMRLLSSGVAIPLKDIGLSESNFRKLREVILKPYGIVLVCGPTGSGKTTMLHSILREISRPEIKVWTAEDPVEISQDHLCQVQINPKIGLDFASVIRAFMRADPDVIMIGEMRDQETAKVALEASLTGHLVLSTLHTNSAAESVTRLIEMGMDPFNFADAMLAVLAQRLAKKLCPACKTSHQASASELLEIAEEFASLASVESMYHQKDLPKLVKHWREQYGDESGNIQLYTHVGCASCGNSGFRGRIGLHELIITSPEIKRLIRHKAAVPDIVIQSIKDGTKTLKQDGIEKVLLGETTLYQIRAACI